MEKRVIPQVERGEIVGVIHSGPDAEGRYRYSLYWWADYHPGHPEGEYRWAIRGQGYYAALERFNPDAHKPVRWVEVVNGGRDVALPGSNPDQRDSGYMGFFPVGSTCAKKHFPEATHADIP